MNAKIKMLEAITVIKTLLDLLPDSEHVEDETWNWCWDELSGDSQDAVKKARKVAADFLAREGKAQ